MADEPPGRGHAAEQRGDATTVEEVVWAVLGAALAWLLRYFRELQDALLAVTVVRRAVLCSMEPAAVRKAVARAVQPSHRLSDSFEGMPYHVPEDAQRLLLHAGAHTLLSRAAASQPPAQLPRLGHVLLKAGSDSERFQVAVASALAARMGADLLVVDGRLLGDIASTSLGEGGEGGAGTCTTGTTPESEEDALLGGGAQGGLLPFFLSFFLSGGRLAFVWEALRRACENHGSPLVLVVPNAEQLIAGSPAQAAAFEGAFGADAGCGRRFLVVAGTALGEAGAHLLPGAASRRGGEGGRGVAQPPAQPAPDGLDDGAPRLLPTAAELGLSLEELGPNRRETLAGLFLIQVPLGPLPEGPEAAAHRAQIAADVEDERAERNRRALASLAKRHCLCVPEEDRLLRQGTLAEAEWEKVLAWAAAMELLLREKEGDPVGTPPPLPLPPPRPLPSAAKALACMYPQVAERQLAEGGPGGATGLRRRRAASSDDLAGLSSAPLRRGLERQQLLASRGQPQAPPLLALSSAAHPAGDADPPPLAIRSAAMLYGLGMLKLGGSLRKQVRADNQYERALLPEVLFPEDAGSGFSEVGALEKAKDALREAVQLPLLHPDLFFRSRLLNAPCRGVLLFGPPGTGKTMLARAVAAECGASFLVLSPSALVSKWMGDANRFVRAAFNLAHKLSPCCMFVDEVDALLSRRSGMSEHEATRELKNEFMSQWDGIASAGKASRVMDLDEAVLRRFNRRVFCDLPDTGARVEILRAILSGERLGDDVSLEAVASGADGFSGSDLRRLATAAGMRPVRELLREDSRARGAMRGASTLLGAGQPAEGAPGGAPSLDGAAAEVLADCLAISVAPERSSQDRLRPLSAEDFVAARAEVTASVDADGHTMRELREWSAKFGEGDKSGQRNATLSYFM
eukprot:jgi/Tetstr1/456226/TSEL_042989.t1